MAKTSALRRSWKSEVKNLAFTGYLARSKPIFLLDDASCAILAEKMYFAYNLYFRTNLRYLHFLQDKNVVRIKKTCLPLVDIFYYKYCLALHLSFSD